MLFKSLLTVALLALAVKAQMPIVDLTADGKLTNTDDFIAEAQGANNNTYVIIFSIEDGTDYVAPIKAALEAGADDETLGGFDLFQDDYEGEDNFSLGQIDARDRSNYGGALDIIGADEPDFKMTYPVVLIAKSGKAILGSFTSMTCLLYTSPSPRDLSTSRMPSSA